MNEKLTEILEKITEALKSAGCRVAGVLPEITETAGNNYPFGLIDLLEDEQTGEQGGAIEMQLRLTIYICTQKGIRKREQNNQLLYKAAGMVSDIKGVCGAKLLRIHFPDNVRYYAMITTTVDIISAFDMQITYRTTRL